MITILITTVVIVIEAIINLDCVAPPNGNKPQVQKVERDAG